MNKFTEHNICNQYYKDLESGVEMLFRFDTQRGWSVSFINLEDEQEWKFREKVTK